MGSHSAKSVLSDLEQSGLSREDIAKFVTEPDIKKKRALLYNDVLLYNASDSRRKVLEMYLNDANFLVTLAALKPEDYQDLGVPVAQTNITWKQYLTGNTNDKLNRKQFNLYDGSIRSPASRHPERRQENEENNEWIQKQIQGRFTNVINPFGYSCGGRIKTDKIKVEGEGSSRKVTIPYCVGRNHSGTGRNEQGDLVKGVSKNNGNITVGIDGKVKVDPEIYKELYLGAESTAQKERAKFCGTTIGSGMRDEEKHLARAIVGAYKLTQPKLTLAERAKGVKLAPLDISQIQDPCIRRRVAKECRWATPSIKTTYGGNAEMEQRDKKYGGSLRHIADTVYDKTFGALGRAMGIESWGIVRASAKQVEAHKAQQENIVLKQQLANLRAGKEENYGITQPTEQIHVNQRLR